MPDAKVLLVNFGSDEVAYIRELLSQFDLSVGDLTASAIEDAERGLSGANILLVVLRVNEQLMRPDQGIRRIKRAISQSVPILVLLPPELAFKVRYCFRAGADEYWILPMDAAAFPPRLYVLLDWGRSVADEKAVQREEGEFNGKAKTSLLKRMWNAVRRAAGFGLRPARVETTDAGSQSLGRWEKVRRLGFGSFGEVWLVQEKDGDRLAVAKVPHSAKMNTRFVREAAILKGLEGHRNAVGFIEVVKERDTVTLIQEYVEGETLQELLDQGMESASKEKAFLELLEIVAYAHEKKIMHRDIKPENIIINLDGVLKLLDFGVGKDMTRFSISNTVVGSRPYMAPEQIMGKSRLASDVWALGVILYALSTGFLPFYDDNEKQLMDMILEVEPQLPRSFEPNLPEEFELILLRCLQKDIDKRYGSALELKLDLIAHFPDFGEGKVLPA